MEISFSWARSRVLFPRAGSRTFWTCRCRRESPLFYCLGTGKVRLPQSIHGRLKSPKMTKMIVSWLFETIFYNFSYRWKSCSATIAVHQCQFKNFEGNCGQHRSKNWLERLLDVHLLLYEGWVRPCCAFCSLEVLFSLPGFCSGDRALFRLCRWLQTKTGSWLPSVRRTLGYMTARCKIWPLDGSSLGSVSVFFIERVSTWIMYSQITTLPPTELPFPPQLVRSSESFNASTVPTASSHESGWLPPLPSR